MFPLTNSVFPFWANSHHLPQPQTSILTITYLPSTSFQGRPGNDTWVLFLLLSQAFNTLPWWFRWQGECLQCRRPGFHPWVRKIPWRRKWQPTPVFLPGKSHRWRSVAGPSPWGHKARELVGVQPLRPAPAPQGSCESLRRTSGWSASSVLILKVFRLGLKSEIEPQGSAFCSLG